ncbi:MAG: hypothetical protein HFF39_05175 [Lawsonibacter sp.]|nr:hypothetical protein [Lawsonibacter sp.]
MSPQTEREKIEAMLKTCTLKRASKDSSNGEYLCESQLQVLNFDQMPQLYRQTCPTAQTKSNDALYIAPNDVWYFIEFKNGQVRKADIHNKIYDSVLMLLDMKIIPDLDFARRHMEYILVYNREKNQRLEQSQSRDDLYGYMGRLAQQEACFWDIGRFAGYLLKNSHTYSQEEFREKFVEPMEKTPAGAGA